MQLLISKLMELNYIKWHEMNDHNNRIIDLLFVDTHDPFICYQSSQRC